MFDSWSIKKILSVFLPLLLIIAIIQVFLLLYSQNMYIHFGISFLALFIALILFHSINIKLKRIKK
jgi:hypothetical protein